MVITTIFSRVQRQRCMHLPTPLLHEQDKQKVTQCFKSFPSPGSVAIQRLKSTVCSTILPIAEKRILWFIPFPRSLASCEMQTDSSRIWTYLTISIPYDSDTDEWFLIIIANLSFSFFFFFFEKDHIHRWSQNRCNPLIWWFITETSVMAVVWKKTSCKNKSFELETSNKCFL